MLNSGLYTYNKRGTRMLVSTDYKEFNNQTNFISNGNVIANTQYSMNIRNVFETDCNGCSFDVGELRRYDLKFFIQNFDYEMKRFFNEFKENCYLYEFSIYNKKKERKKVIGWLVYNEQHNHLLKYHVSDDFKFYNKGKSVLDLADKIISSKNF